jgi:hypothetical protein
MKFSKIIVTLVLTTFLFSCSSDDPVEQLSGQTGSLALKFDNGVGNNDFLFNTTYNRSNGESFEISNLKYIISNVRLTDENGMEFMYPELDNAFIVSEANGNNAGEIFINLENVQAANYTSITFGVGIDQERFTKGAERQGHLLDLAQEEGMMWSWASGYKFIRIDGTYSNANVNDQPLNIHMGSVGTSLDNYREVTLDLPNASRVRAEKNAQIHLKADIMKIFEGNTSVNFGDGYDQVHTNATTTPVIADNIATMFSVDHVHND